MAAVEPADGALLISLERSRHPLIGYDTAHDARHSPEYLANLAAQHLAWPLTVQNLTQAGSLIAAAIDRLIEQENAR